MVAGLMFLRGSIGEERNSYTIWVANFKGLKLVSFNLEIFVGIIFVGAVFHGCSCI